MIVGAAIKKGLYRGPKKYMTAVKNLHISEGYAWSDLLGQAAHRFNTSTTRGLGPTWQSEPLPFLRVAGLALEDLSVAPAAPSNPSAVVALSTFYPLRE